MLAGSKVVLHVGHARHGLGEVLRPATLVAVPDRAGERHLPVLDGHLDLRRVEKRIVREAVVHVVADSVVRALVVARTATAVLAPPDFALAPGRVVAETGVAGPHSVVAMIP